MKEQFPILRKEHPSKSSLGYSPARGGIVTSLILAGREVFYFDQNTFNNPASSVRGGIPILFPNAGELADPAYPGLKRHGFARDSVWEARETECGFKEILVSDNKTRKKFPYEFELEFEGELLGTSSARFTQRAVNTGASPLPVAMGLHPYFKVPSSEKKGLRFIFPGGDEIERRAEEWISGDTVSMANPGRIEMHIPNAGRLILTASPEYTRIWIWSEPGKDFVCVEPVMREAGGIAHDPCMILPGEAISLEFRIEAEE